MNNKSLPPSERAEKQSELDKKAKILTEQQQSLLREDFGRTFQTEHGMRVLAWIMERSGFGKVILSASSEHGIDEKLSTYAAMELNFYLAIRRNIQTDILARVEYGEIKPAGFVDLSEKTKAKSKPKKKEV